jgi:phycocyanobilin lyase alpha subunit
LLAYSGPTFLKDPMESEGPLTSQQAIINLQQKEDSSLRYYAAWWLGRFRVKEEEAIDALIDALDDETNRAPDGGYPLRRNAAKALGKLGNKKAVLPLIKSLSSTDYYVRESAAQSLEMLLDSRAIPHLMRLISGGLQDAVYVKGKPHLREPVEAAIEALGALKAIEAMNLIKPFLEHELPKVQFAAARALYQLTQDPFYGEKLVLALQSSDLQLRRSALMDLGAIGYFPAAKAIANTFAENSLKLISLKGLLEQQIKKNTPQEKISLESIEIINLMDGLL